MNTHRTIVRFVFTAFAASSLFCASPLRASEYPAVNASASDYTRETVSLNSSRDSQTFELPTTTGEAESLEVPPTTGEAVPLDISPTARMATLEQLLDNAIARRLISGGVVVVGNHEGIIATASRGTLDFSGKSPVLSEHTIFDLASLTKVIATAPAVMKLLDEGRITLSDPLSRWFPELAPTPLRNVTLLNLLTHTSGLEDFNLHQGQSMKTVLDRVAAQRPRSTGHFHYADVNFILLGEMVRRVSGETLDVFCRQEIYAPLAAHDTLFLPPRELARSIAPTLGYDSGVVQDTNARRLGGVAGHAGLFSSAYDLSRYARLILGGGELENRRILSREVVMQMTTPYACSNGSVTRGLGWDIASPFSAPRGNFFSRLSFGHTGYSGSSIWIDPQQDLFVIFLTNRLEYRNVHAFNRLRSDISTVAVTSLHDGGNGTGTLPSLELAKMASELVRPGTAPTIRLASYAVNHGGHGKKCRLTAHKKGKERHLAKAGRHGSRAKAVALRKRHARSRRNA